MNNITLETIAGAYKDESAYVNLREAYLLLAQATARLVAAHCSTQSRETLDVATLAQRAQLEALSIVLPEVRS